MSHVLLKVKLPAHVQYLLVLCIVNIPGGRIGSLWQHWRPLIGTDTNVFQRLLVNLYRHLFFFCDAFGLLQVILVRHEV